jgi:hypothetical protein
MEYLEQPLNNIFDLNVWFMLQLFYWPHYVIGKQDEWQKWSKISLNGIKGFNICKPK